MKSISGTQYICSSCTLCCMLSKSYAYITIECMTNVLWPTIRKFIYFWKFFHAVSYTALENHVPLPRFPETFSMWYRIVYGTKWHRFHYCCNLWWVQPLYCINTLDYYTTLHLTLLLWCRRVKLYASGVTELIEWFSSRFFFILPLWRMSCGIVISSIVLSTNDGSSQPLAGVMAWCHVATSHCLSQFWQSPMIFYGVIREQRFLVVAFSFAHVWFPTSNRCMALHMPRQQCCRCGCGCMAVWLSVRT